MPHILKRVPRSSLRARNNMAMRMLPGGVPEFDTVEEMVAYQRAMGQVGVPAQAPQRAAPPPVHYQQAPQQMVSQATQRDLLAIMSAAGYSPAPAKSRGGGGNKAFVISPEKAGGPVSPGQGKYITSSIGGFAKLCGSKEAAEAARQAGFSSDMLNTMGLTFEGASNVISEMKRRGVDGFNQSDTDPEKLAKAAVAREILFSVGGISCAAKSNYGARSNRSNRYR